MTSVSIRRFPALGEDIFVVFALQNRPPLAKLRAGFPPSLLITGSFFYQSTLDKFY